MSKTLTKLLLSIVCIALTGCAGSPSSPDSGKTAAKQPSKPVDVDPQIANQYKLALATLKQGNETEALKQFKAIGDKAPQLAGAFINQGLIYLHKAQFADAEKALTQAVTANSNNTAAQLYLGVALRELGKFDKAEQAYQKAIQLDDNNANAHLNLGILYDIYLNDLNHALEQYEKYQSLTNSKDEQIAKWIADVKLRQSKAK